MSLNILSLLPMQSTIKSLIKSDLGVSLVSLNDLVQFELWKKSLSSLNIAFVRDSKTDSTEKSSSDGIGIRDCKDTPTNINAI